LAGLAGVIGVVIVSQFVETRQPRPPDGILRVGDCVEIQPNTDAAEVPCGTEDDLVVRAFVPFDGTCPGLSEPHRDRQGMGIACVTIPDDS
jgi:molecular chaperone DnaJ